MDNYQEYIDRLKQKGQGVDFDLMLSKIESKVNHKPKYQLVLATALAFVLLVSVGYYSYMNSKMDNDLLMSYVFQQEVGDGPVIEYVFNNNGTF